MTDEPGAPLTGTWVSSDGFYEYYTVDQAFFEGVYVSIEGVHVAHMWGYSFDGANYVAWYEEYSTEDDTYFSWGNAAGIYKQFKLRFNFVRLHARQWRIRRILLDPSRC